MNEIDHLPKILKTIEIFQHPNIAVEFIFVDGGSSDETVNYLQRFSMNVISSERGRGKQLHKGALASQGDYLLFLHADSYFAESPVEEIVRISDHYSMGAFQLNFIPDNLLLKFIAWGSNWRVKYRNIAFGDQGIFIKRKVYFEIGGFPDIPIMEDYEFSRKIDSMGYKFGISSHQIYTSSRLFQKLGVVRTLIRMQYCQYLYRKNVPIHRILKIYNKNK